MCFKTILEVLLMIAACMEGSLSQSLHLLRGQVLQRPLEEDNWCQQLSSPQASLICP